MSARLAANKRLRIREENGKGAPTLSLGARGRATAVEGVA
jgi:hypothetical protein